MRLAGLLVLASILSACGPADAPRAQATSEPRPTARPAVAATASEQRASPQAKLALDAEGLRIVAADSGKSLLLAFGARRGQVEQAVQRIAGAPPERSTGEECPAGPTQFTRFGGLQLAFQEDRWIGWALSAADTATTIDGIGLGTTRREAEASRTVTAIPESTLGDEFVLGTAEQEIAIGGIFSEPGAAGRIEYLWAGVACNFR